MRKLATRELHGAGKTSGMGLQEIRQREFPVKDRLSFRKRHKRRTQRTQRRGVAAAELAVALPALVILVLASIESTGMIFLREGMSATAYETLRMAVRADGSTAAANARATEMLTSREINGATVTLDPPVMEAVERGETVVVTATAPCAANSMLPAWFFAGKQMTVTATMVKE